MFRALNKARLYEKDNEKLTNIFGYYISRRDFGTVINIINNAGEFTKDNNYLSRLNGLFLTNSYLREFFGIGANIVDSMKNMLFGGEVSILSKDDKYKEKLAEIHHTQAYMNAIIEAYKTAIATNGKAYLFYNVDTINDEETGSFLRDDFIGYDVVPTFELKFERNKVIRTFIKEVTEKEFYRFEYNYINIDDEYILDIVGYNANDEIMKSDDVKRILGIDVTYKEFTYKPYDVLDIGDGMLPNILFIENSLAENLYFQDEDLVNSQTIKYVPEEQLLDNAMSTGEAQKSFNDRYKTTKIVRGHSIDRHAAAAVDIEGKSSIAFIERNLALNVIQACLDAKISPISIGYVLTDKMGSNTDVGSDKERVSIRLREFHIDNLKIFMPKVLRKIFLIDGIETTLDEFNVLFAQYITPSIESLTNTLAKQVQFGIKSREQAILDLSRGELTPEEIEVEINRIKTMTTQFDFNADTSDKNKKGVDNVLKGEQIVE